MAAPTQSNPVNRDMLFSGATDWRQSMPALDRVSQLKALTDNLEYNPNGSYPGGVSDSPVYAMPYDVDAYIHDVYPARADQLVPLVQPKPPAPIDFTGQAPTMAPLEVPAAQPQQAVAQAQPTAAPPPAGRGEKAKQAKAARRPQPEQMAKVAQDLIGKLQWVDQNTPVTAHSAGTVSFMSLPAAVRKQVLDAAKRAGVQDVPHSFSVSNLTPPEAALLHMLVAKGREESRANAAALEANPPPAGPAPAKETR